MSNDRGKAGDFGKLFAARETSKHLDVQTSKHPDIQTSKHLDVQKPKLSKSKDPNYQRTTVYLPKELHQQLKVAAMAGDREISEVVETLVKAWLNSRP